VLQCVAVCCSVHQIDALFCTVLQYVAATFRVYESHVVMPVCVAVCCSVLQCVAVCCSVLQCVAVFCSVISVLQQVEVCCLRHSECMSRMFVLQCVAVCCSVLLQHSECMSSKL